MSKHENDTVDLRPYLRLWNRIAQKTSLWLRKNLIYILATFIAICALYWGRDLMKETKYDTRAHLESNILTDNELVNMLNAIAGNLKSDDKEQHSDIEGLKAQNIIKLEYKLKLSKVDSMINETIDVHPESLDPGKIVTKLNPIRLRLIMSSHNDSVGKYFLEYINTHEYVDLAKKTKVFQIESRINDVKKQIKDIDTLKTELLASTMERGSNQPISSLIFPEIHSRTDLLKLRNELSQELNRLETERIGILETDEVYSLDGFSETSVVVDPFLREPRSYILLFIYAIVVVAFVSIVRYILFK